MLQATFGGGEANVAVSLAQFGLDSRYVTRVPANPIGDAALRALRAEGVDVGSAVRGGKRLGIYFAETGASQRASTVVYDRAGSAISELKPGTCDWAEVLEGARWMHVTGITPALGPAVAEATVEAVEAARAAGATVSLDLNYRAKLWTKEQARQVMRPLAGRAQVVIANEEDIQATLGIEVRGADVVSGHLDLAGYRAAAERGVGRVRRRDGGDHAAREPLCQPQRMERGALRGGRWPLPRRPALRRVAGRSDRRR